MSAASAEGLSRFFAALSGRDLAALGAFLDEETLFLFPKTEPLRGRARILRFFKILFRQYPRLQFEILETLIDGERASVHWRNDGESRDGLGYANEGVTLFRYEAGRLRWISDFFKDTGRF